jgi:uncharacterized repeat protein (TIGR03803 family)
MKNSKALLTLGLALACAAFTFSLAVRARAQTVTFIADFNGTNGYQPFGTLTQATDGNFYGTTTNGGGHGYGNVYRITPSGEVTSIYNFCLRSVCNDGTTPESAPVLGSDGNLYGTTTGFAYGYGTVYKMTLSGKLTTLYTFCSLAQCADGSFPNGLIQAGDGNFYGTTIDGGNFNEGTIFKITPAGQFTSLYSFCALANCADGDRPVSSPIVGSDGNLYGATWQYPTGGVLYRFTLAGDYKVLYSFCRGIVICSDGSEPPAIVQDANGNFFGTTQYGGGSGNYGTVFELTAKQQFINLHTFDKTDGAYPDEALTLANDGNFYGITAEGGPANAGTIFEITAAGGFRTLYTFAPPYGYNPAGSLLQGTDGNLYGTTPGGPGYDPLGTVFKFSNGLGPSVRTAPGAGKVGKPVLILGNGLTGSTSVTFNGVAAAFTVESDTYIKATVPTGASTGIVSVATPSGTLNSNPQFVVTR